MYAAVAITSPSGTGLDHRDIAAHRANMPWLRRESLYKLRFTVTILRFTAVAIFVLRKSASEGRRTQTQYPLRHSFQLLRANFGAKNISQCKHK